MRDTGLNITNATRLFAAVRRVENDGLSESTLGAVRDFFSRGGSLGPFQFATFVSLCAEKARQVPGNTKERVTGTVCLLAAGAEAIASFQPTNRTEWDRARGAHHELATVRILNVLFPGKLDLDEHWKSELARLVRQNPVNDIKSPDMERASPLVLPGRDKFTDRKGKAENN